MFFGRRGRCSPSLSIVIPWSGGERARTGAFRWLRRYWAAALPEAELVIGHSRGRPFCKTAAFNDAIRRSHGRVLALLDADALLPAASLRRASADIVADLDRGEHLWYLPYRRIYRLDEAATGRVLASAPDAPTWPGDPPPAGDLEEDPGKAFYGRRYAAMAMVIPREAWAALGGFDERFRGWGGEDSATMRAIDTLWGKHKSIDAPLYHLWHPRIGATYLDRQWHGQAGGNVNARLSNAYGRATGDPVAMRALLDAATPEPTSRFERLIAFIARHLG